MNWYPLYAEVEAQIEGLSRAYNALVALGELGTEARTRVHMSECVLANRVRDLFDAVYESLSGADQINFSAVREGLHVDRGQPFHGGMIAAFHGLRSFIWPHVLRQQREVTWSQRVELAVLHLNNLLAADRDASERWRSALKNHGEAAAEKLGAIHFLQHGLFPFKARRGGAGETDLVLGMPLSEDTVRTTAAADAPLVLTEWKYARWDDAGQGASDREAKEVQDKSVDARNQLKSYASSSLAGLRLQSLRYVVLVSEPPLRQIPADIILPEFRVRHLSIVTDPRHPSDRAKRIHHE